MLTKRIIPCLDVKDGKVVKGKNFTGLIEAGDPVALAKSYEMQGADELVLLDITATLEGRGAFLDIVSNCAKELSIPFSVGGGIRSLEDIRLLLNAGADRVSLNSAALNNPQLIKEAADAFGSQCIILAIDVKKTERGWEVFSRSGTTATSLDAVSWALEGQRLGAGEILVTSIDRDGTKKGYDLELIEILSRTLSIPVIASGGVGKIEDIRDAFIKGNADAALAASLFHFDRCSIQELKRFLDKEGIRVRP
jgi:imidazole glycerol-phosphate synthase subunit HisF